MKKLKLIWDFYGEDGKKTAEHHEIHLKEFIIYKQLPINNTGVQKISDNHHTAFMIVAESDMIMVRDLLKPHRGEWYEEEN